MLTSLLLATVSLDMEPVGSSLHLTYLLLQAHGESGLNDSTWSHISYSATSQNLLS